DSRILEVGGMRVQVDERAAEILLDDLFDPWVPDRHEPSIGETSIRVGRDRIADPWIWIVRHRISQRPQHVAPGKHFPHPGLHASEVLGARDVQCLEKQSGEEVELYCKPCAAMQHGARQEARSWEERA